MVTNEERRKVAARMRYVAEHGAPEWETSAECISICLKEPDSPLWSGTEKLFALLADFIEPEPERTCRIVRENVDRDGSIMTDYSCGCFNTEGYNHNYCPSCGAKVVE